MYIIAYTKTEKKNRRIDTKHARCFKFPKYYYKSILLCSPYCTIETHTKYNVLRYDFSTHFKISVTLLFSSSVNITLKRR